MAGKQAKILSEHNLQDLLLIAESSRHPLRNKVMVLLSAKAGLRASEIARVTWAMVTDSSGTLAEFWNCPTLPPRKAAAESFRYMQLYAQPWPPGRRAPNRLAP